ncbi:hypothetical protein [Bradyrhizobium sp. 930_D9_N1_4]|uniref:hypothetical protein n=1 Tax=Bradyrhizobium sp. 930_D9_N1_4 TaxID=3240374 RepID=UPI003F8AE95A
MNLKQLWSIIRGRRTNFSWMNASWTYYPDGDPLGKILLCSPETAKMSDHPMVQDLHAAISRRSLNEVERAANRIRDEKPDLSGELDRMTTSRDYHIRVGDKLAERINVLVPALKEAERFMAYFAGETGGTFVGPGTPQSCLEQIRASLAFPSNK